MKTKIRNALISVSNKENLTALLKVLKKFNIKIMEDAAESVGSFYKGKHLGTFAEVGILSFNGNKLITTGGGGAILTSNKKIAEYAKFLSTTAKNSKSLNFKFDEVGYNYRMPGLNAAFGLSQLKKLNKTPKNGKLRHGPGPLLKDACLTI